MSVREHYADESGNGALLDVGSVPPLDTSDATVVTTLRPKTSRLLCSCPEYVCVRTRERVEMFEGLTGPDGGGSVSPGSGHVPEALAACHYTTWMEF